MFAPLCACVCFVCACDAAGVVSLLYIAQNADTNKRKKDTICVRLCEGVSVCAHTVLVLESVAVLSMGTFTVK